MLSALLLGCAAPALDISSSTTSIPGRYPTPARSLATIPPANQPNILFILTDDLDVDSIAYMPNLQSLLVDKGASFTNFFVNVSLCCPSRASILKGQYAHNTQILGNRPPAGGFEKFYAAGEEESTIATWLHSANYQTALIGKYLNGYPLGVKPKYIPPGWDEWYSLVDGNPYEGFNYTLNQNGKLVKYGSKAKDYSTDVYVGLAADFITRASASEKPFFLYLAPYAPHGPATPAPRHSRLFPGTKAPQSPSFNEKDVKDKPEYVRSHPRMDAGEIAYINHLYRRRLQSLQAVDEMIASLVDLLDRTGELNKTYIFFVPDNGFLMGQHRLGAGKVAPYEESIRVPLIVRGPKVPPGIQIGQLTGNIDLAPTWAELAGTAAPDSVDGRSLLPLLDPGEGSPPNWRQAYLVIQGSVDEEVANNLETLNFMGMGLPLDPITGKITLTGISSYDIPSFNALRLEDALYVEYETGERELYNLVNDHYQLANIYEGADPELIRRLSSWVNQLIQCSGDSCREIDRG